MKSKKLIEEENSNQLTLDYLKEVRDFKAAYNKEN
ncbi:uncharacterized protein METZ01_LOCUS509468, partial [marine metagenome]